MPPEFERQTPSLSGYQASQFKLFVFRHATSYCLSGSFPCRNQLSPEGFVWSLRIVMLHRCKTPLT
jgi:hypothetical protein